MSTRLEIDPGICGFPLTACVSTDDQQHVKIELESECQSIQELKARWDELGPIDAIAELAPDESVILKAARSLLQSKGCCEACVVPIGIVKAVQVTAGLALPKDVSIKMTVDG